MSVAGTGDGHPPDEALGAATRAAFFAAYDRMLVRWPAGSGELDLTSEFGRTRVHVTGPVDAPPLLLLHAYQATSAQWVALAGLLSGERRIYAVDLMGDAGHSTPGTRPVATPADLVEYLDTVLDGLGLRSAEVCGHSFGGWIALTYGLERPARVDRLILLDPTMSVAPLLKGYVFRAIPALLKPTAANRLSLIRWETRKADLDPEWLQVTGAAADAFRGLPSVPTRIPDKAALAALQVPVLVIVAGRSRVHQVQRVAKRSGKMPRSRVETLTGATHYGLPLTHADQIAALILQDGEI
jgi:pimeloyl-ACP methyl ester carboxylesterase